MTTQERARGHRGGGDGTRSTGLAGCNAAAVDDILARAVERQAVRTRQREDALREVFVLDGRYVLKRFTWTAGDPAPRPLWRKEHAALGALEGLPFPASIGYRQREQNGQAVMEYLRTYLPGEPVQSFGLPEARLAAELLASAHERGVVTDDALMGNFLRLPDGRLGFVDLGRARVFSHRGPDFATFVGRELAKFRRHCLRHEPALVQEFQARYFACTPLSGTGRLWARWVANITVWLRRLRKGVIQGQPDKA